MAQAELNVEIRERSGKGVARKLRAAGKLPAVVYGKTFDSQAIIVDPNALERIVTGKSGWNTLITLKGAPELEGKVVVLRDADLHPLRRDMLCADFHVINLQKKAAFMVPVNTVGTSVGEKEGGTLQLVRKELEVFCLPTEVPQAIDIDVTALEIGDTIHIDEVVAPAGIELVQDINFTVITLVGHQAEEEEGEEDVTEGEEVAVAGEDSVAE